MPHQAKEGVHLGGVPVQRAVSGVHEKRGGVLRGALIGCSWCIFSRCVNSMFRGIWPCACVCDFKRTCLPLDEDEEFVCVSGATSHGRVC